MVAGPCARSALEVDVLVAVVVVHVGFPSALSRTDSAQYFSRRLFEDPDNFGFLVAGFASQGAGNDQIAVIRGPEIIAGDSQVGGPI
jgi:hypothetical protein